MKKYVRRVRSIEQVTGVRRFSSLNDKIQPPDNSENFYLKMAGQNVAMPSGMLVGEVLNLLDIAKYIDKESPVITLDENNILRFWRIKP